jgi:trigger factor
MSKHHEHHSHSEFIKDFSVERKEGSVVVVTGEIPFEDLKAHEDHVLAHLTEGLELKGFRKGHVPAAMARKHVGEMRLLQETAEHVLAEIYPEILVTHTIDAIGRPQINITKLAAGNPFGFTLTITVMPEVKLPDYTKIAAGINKTKETATITEKDVDEAIERIQRQKLAYDRIQEKAKARAEAEEAKKKASADGLTLPTPETAAAAADEKEEDYSKLPVPELTDEYVKTLGAFESVDAFKTQVREHLEKEKMDEAMSRHRGALTEALIEGATIDLPELLVRSEIAQIKGQMEDDLRRAGLTVEGYLEHMKKTMEDMEKEWRPTAEKRAKTQLILNEIAKQESIEPDKDAVAGEMAGILAHYKDADVERVRIYVESVLRNNAVMKFLEEQK